MNFLTGPDVSFYQDAPTTPQQIDFAKMKAAGASFVIIRAGQNNWIDPDFAFNWKAAKEAGIPRGLYWFYDSRSSPRTQTDKLKEAVGADYPECGVWADFEERYGGNYGSQARLREFMELLKDTFPSTVEIGVYTAYYWWVDRITEPAYWIRYPLWIANYQTLAPLVPPPWKPDGWSFWQYTDKGDGLKYGAESLNIDMNYYNGGLPEFYEQFGIAGNVPPRRRVVIEGDFTITEM